MGVEMALHERDVFNADCPNIVFESLGRRTVASYERELTRHRRTEISLRQALARARGSPLSKGRVDPTTGGFEPRVRSSAVERPANDRKPAFAAKPGRRTNAEVASQLAAAADRIATIGRIHRRLHSFDGVQTFAIKQYLEDLCRDFSMMLSSEGRPERVIVVEGIEIKLPAVTAIPLGFIANELITNAAKYGTGRITIGLEPNPGKGYALSVSNDGPGLPEGFDPADRKRLGMRIIRSLVERIGGQLRIGRGDRDQGTRFTVLFS